MTDFLDAFGRLDAQSAVVLAFALAIAFGFEVVNGFHDTANAVTTVIYTRTLKATPAVLFSGVCNFLGVLLGGTTIAFSIVHLLPVDLLIDAASRSAVVMVLALLVAGISWNLLTWWFGIPVSSSHTLIGAILGVGLANGVMSGRGLGAGVNWEKAGEVGLALLISPAIGFLAAAALLLAAKRAVPDPELYVPPPEDPSVRPPRWIRATLLATCGGVSLAHGSNDGQKGMGLIMLVLIGLLPTGFALNLDGASGAVHARDAATELRAALLADPSPIHRAEIARIDEVLDRLGSKTSLREVPHDDRIALRNLIYQVDRGLERDRDVVPEGRFAAIAAPRRQLRGAIEYVPGWVIVGVALCLGVGTTVGYKRIVHTIAEKIGKTHLTYAQGASAEVVAMATIGAADLVGLPVSTTQVLSSGVAGTMWANRSGVQLATARNIALAWLLTFPCSMLASAGIFVCGRLALR
ncbi:inorganic phosphate transporter [Paludisphaera mucosa]|uniref:Phosphate transporter n=1 Tax=Paludisphaera mucosa TaxID=3030827 RepID=A0ABT6FJS6_9BACT|nr:inorganic phosphate transporter [Paludisphaera mucosa]MDG3007830.1 inorganic phosphate transporter [Paludisphaera mucosa]